MSKAREYQEYAAECFRLARLVKKTKTVVDGLERLGNEFLARALELERVHQSCTKSIQSEQLNSSNDG